MSMIQEPSNQLDGNRWESWRNPWWLQSYFCNWMVKIPSIAGDTGLGVTYCMSTSNTHNIRQWILWVWNLGFLSITICFSLPSLRIIRLLLSWSSSSFSWLPFFLCFCGCTVMPVRTENVSFVCLPTSSPILCSFWYSKQVWNHSFHLRDILVTKMENRHSHCPQNGTQHHCTNKQTHNYCSWYLWCWMGLQKQGRSGHWIGFAVGRGGRGFLSGVYQARTNRAATSPAKCKAWMSNLFHSSIQYRDSKKTEAYYFSPHISSYCWHYGPIPQHQMCTPTPLNFVPQPSRFCPTQHGKTHSLAPCPCTNPNRK